MKKAFTLVEMLIVIGILGILMTVMLGTFRGGTDSARAAKCINNMRNLSQAVISVAMGSVNSGENCYPAAGSLSFYTTSGSKSGFYPRIGWISWLNQNKTTKIESSYVQHPNAAACCENEDDVTHALTNGTIWVAMHRDRESYVCPIHLKHARDKHLPTPHWSYCMNSFFGYNSGSLRMGDTYGRRFSSINIRPDKRLLFAELPFAIPGSTDSSNEVSEDSAYGTANDNFANDCTLQYRANANGFNRGVEWKRTPEAIAFNHKNGKRFCAHVSFADGHTEKLLMPKPGAGINAAQLTMALCEGLSVSFDGNRYDIISKTTDEDIKWHDD